MMVLQVFSHIPLKKRCQFRGEHIFKMIRNASVSLNACCQISIRGSMYAVFTCNVSSVFIFFLRYLCFLNCQIIQWLLDIFTHCFSIITVDPFGCDKFTQFNQFCFLLRFYFLFIFVILSKKHNCKSDPMLLILPKLTKTIQINKIKICQSKICKQRENLFPQQTLITSIDISFDSKTCKQIAW